MFGETDGQIRGEDGAATYAGKIGMFGVEDIGEGFDGTKATGEDDEGTWGREGLNC